MLYISYACFSFYITYVMHVYGCSIYACLCYCSLVFTLYVNGLQIKSLQTVISQKIFVITKCLMYKHVY
ncbi:TPA_asm: hypothetical protein [Tilapia adomavirus 1]|uniref:Uncharacterized protein n=1 Tax=Tilapia adomavirus 1 TaxID=2597803 RepID=A0A5H3CX44_9VIRU|nr:TPA_asm: hypothetical protein [Tilapia adomavirus 1]